MPERDETSLAGSASPFLQHGAGQPVAWLPWGRTAFDRARAENRPVLLDIGAVWCHWCHVMDHESYEDDETAALINELFVPVKVDRDERPDVDARYQRAVQALTGQGGWPLTAFLTPEGEVFYGGTYFPPDDRYGRPSFRRVLREVARVWAEEPERAREMVTAVQERTGAFAQAERGGGHATEALVEQGLEAFAGEFDFRYGGFGSSPKFPNAGALQLLLDRYLDQGTDWAGRIVVETLDAMAGGGIFDQLGGGFHRYSTDARWRVPHFEKMAYDNGVLLEVFARAAGALEKPAWRALAERVVAHYRDIAGDLVDAGGFPASQDADIGPTDDGDYWTWTKEEVTAALDGDPRLSRVALLRFGVGDATSAMHLDPRRHVLFLAAEAPAIARQLGTTEDDAAALIAEVERRLKDARARHPAPYIDRTLYTGWVGLVASGHIAATRHAGVADAGEAAVRALDRIWDAAFATGVGIAHRAADGESDGAGYYLSDQAHVAQALLDAFELTQQERFLSRARELAGIMIERFREPSGGMLDRPVDEDAPVAALAEPNRPIADSPEPSGNGTAALVLLRLAALTHEDDYAARAGELLDDFAAAAGRIPTAVATYLRAVDWATSPVTTVVVVGSGAPRDDDLFRVALETYRPRTVIRRFEPAGLDPDRLPPELRAMVTADAPRAYVCAGRTCAAPVADPEALRTLLREFRG
jgi:uncharacterized protein